MLYFPKEGSSKISNVIFRVKIYRITLWNHPSESPSKSHFGLTLRSHSSESPFEVTLQSHPLEWPPSSVNFLNKRAQYTSEGIWNKTWKYGNLKITFMAGKKAEKNMEVLNQTQLFSISLALWRWPLSIANLTEKIATKSNRERCKARNNK